MTQSDLWRELSIGFQCVSETHEFNAFRQYYMELRYFLPQSKLEPEWKLEATHLALVEFRPLAIRAATMLTPLPTSDLVVRWLEALWKQETEGPVRSGIPIIGKDRTGRLTQLRGKIDHVFQKSFALCKDFETETLKIEFEENRLNIIKEPVSLRRNRGDGTFEDVSRKAGVDDAVHAYGMQGIWFDYDNDGWPDLYVANDIVPKYLYHNNHDGTFEDVSLISGAAVDANGKAQSTMGVSTADFDHSGWLGVFITNFSTMPNTLYRNQGDKGFTDIGFASELGRASLPYVAWGAAFIDVDNDGWLDLVVSNGHVYPQADMIKGVTPYRQPIVLFRNNGDRTFQDVSKSAGLDKLQSASWRGLAAGDVDNDGKIDVLVMDADGPPVLLMNRTVSPNHAVMFRLIGKKSNKAAIGARVTVKSGDLKQMSEVQAGSSYLSQNDLRLHFGLGSRVTVDKVEILWPSGVKETLSNLSADSIYTVVEGKGVTESSPFAKRTKQMALAYCAILDNGENTTHPSSPRHNGRGKK